MRDDLPAASRTRELHHLIRVGEVVVTDYPEPVTVYGRTFVPGPPMEVAPITIEVLQGNNPFTFSMVDTDNALMNRMLAGLLRKDPVEYWRLESDGQTAHKLYTGIVDSAVIVEKAASLVAGTLSAGYESVKYRSTSVEDQKAINSGDTAFDAIDGGNAVGRARVNWESR